MSASANTHGLTLSNSHSTLKEKKGQKREKEGSEGHFLPGRSRLISLNTKTQWNTYFRMNAKPLKNQNEKVHHIDFMPYFYRLCLECRMHFIG